MISKTKILKFISAEIALKEFLEGKNSKVFFFREFISDLPTQQHRVEDAIRTQTSSSSSYHRTAFQSVRGLVLLLWTSLFA